MGIDESEVSRLLRGDVPSDDPVWGDVSGFLDDVSTGYPIVPTTALEGSHLAAIARESRRVHAELGHPYQRAVKRMFRGPHRILAGSVAAFLIALTAGVGVASALGINPLEQLMSHLPVSSPTAPLATASTTAGTNDPAGSRQEGEPGTTAPRVVPGPTPGAPPTPSPTPTRSPGSVGDEHKNPRATEKANNAATPTPHKAKPTHKATATPHTAKPKPPKAPPAPPGKNKKHTVGDVDSMEVHG
ncbi:MAG: hypothetical protein ACOH1Y_16150 [Propionicimonas sp.]